MTEEEFLMSLPFTLSTEEREKRLEEWREKNPPKPLETPTEKKEEDQGPAQPTREEQEEADRINNINKLYARYNKDLERFPFMSDEEEEVYNNAANATLEQKIEWLNNNTSIKSDEEIEGIYQEQSFWEQLGGDWGLYESEAERAIEMQEDQDLLVFHHSIFCSK